MADPKIDAAVKVMHDLAPKNVGFWYGMTEAFKKASEDKTATQGRQLGNAVLLQMRGKGEPYKAWADTLAAALALPSATIKASSLGTGAPTTWKPDAGGVGDALGNVGDALTPDWASGAFSVLTSPHLWVRVGQVVLGVLLVVVAAARLAGPTVLQASPIGRLAKAAS